MKTFNFAMKKLDFSKKPIIAMLHLKGDSEADMMNRMIREAITYYVNGVDAVLVENYFGSAHDCKLALEWLYHNMPNKCYGVNILGDYKEAFRLAKEYHADFVQIDSVCGHLKPGEDKKYASELIEDEKDRTFDVLGGLRFKYQSVRSGRTLEEDAELAKLRCDAVVTTGAGTGMDTATEKLMEFRQVLGEYPLIVGAGVTADTVAEKLKYADGVIIGSWLKEGHSDYGDVCEEYVKAFMEEVNSARASAGLGDWIVNRGNVQTSKSNDVRFYQW